MENNLVGFKKYNGKKSDLLNITVEPGDIIFGIDSETNLPYIYHDGVFYSDASEWSEALPEIHIGPTMPPEKDPYIKLWVDTDDNPPTLKYKNSDTNDWEDVSSNIDITETNEIFIGDNLPADISDNIKVWYQTNVDLPEEDIVVSWEDVQNKPTFAEVAFTGSYTDLKDTPDTIKKTYYVHGQIDREKYHLINEQLLDNIYAKRSINNQEDANYIIHVVDNDKYYKDSVVVTNAEAQVILVAVCFDDEDSTIGNKVVDPSVTSVQITITNGDIIGGEPMGGSGVVNLDSAHLSTKTYVDLHTTTYIGADTPTNSKYNLWVDTTKEEVVFKYKEGNEWKVLSTGGSGNIVVDTEFDDMSNNPIANKTVTNVLVDFDNAFYEFSQALPNKADIENGLVEGRGFKVTDNLKYYLPGTTTSSDPTVDNSNIIATKADTLSNEVIDNKATVYNLYAMDDLSAEQLEANAKAVESVQNREVAIYKVYTNDDTYAIADVKLVPGPYLEGYVYINTPNTTDKQATITRYKYSFNQAGEYLPSDKDVEEIVVPSIDKVNELISSGGTGGGVKLYKVYQNPQNADELAANKAAYDAIAASEDAIYQMNWVIGWITASYAISLMDICGLVFAQTAPGEDGSLVQSGIITLLINSDGSILNFTEQQAYVPTTEKVEEMIAQAGGGGTGGGSENSGGTKTYTVYCELSEDETEKALQLEANIAAYNACNNNEDAVYKIVLPIGCTIISTSTNSGSGSVGFIGEIAMGGYKSYGAILTYMLDIASDGTPAYEQFIYNLQSSEFITIFLDTTTTEKTAAGVTEILGYLQAGQSIVIIWKNTDGNIALCNNVEKYNSSTITVACTIGGIVRMYTISTSGKITPMITTGIMQAHAGIEVKNNTEIYNALSWQFAGTMKVGTPVNIKDGNDYYQVLHVKRKDDAYVLTVLSDDTTLKTYTLLSDGTLTLNS